MSRELLAQAYAEMSEPVTEEKKARAVQLACRFVQEHSPSPHAHNQRDRRHRAVCCRTVPSIQWESIEHAAKALGCFRNSVYEAIRRGGTVCGLFLRYVDTPEADCPPMRAKCKAVKWKGKVYPSIQAAADATAEPGVKKSAAFMRVARHARRLTLDAVGVA